MTPPRDRPTCWLASIYPAAFAAGYVLISFSTTPTPVGGLWRPLLAAIVIAAAVQELRASGYGVATVPPPFESASLFTADEVRPTGHMTSFEPSLIQHSPLIGALLAIAPDVVLDQQRQRVENALDDLEAIATEPSDRPVFAFVHVLSPDAPIVFGPDGQLPPLPSCFPEDCSLWEIASAEQWRTLPAQIDELNRRVIDTLESVVGSDPDAVVLVKSDHGVQPPGGDLATMLNNFTALRAPGAPDLLGDRPHTVSVLALIAQEYAGIPATRRDYEGWVSAPEHPLTMQPAR